MGKIKVITNLTLDGVMQSPARAEEDQRDGFKHGGWAAPFGAMQQPEAGEAFADMGALLFGRWTYESFFAFWPNQTDNQFTEFFNNITKFVVSTTLDEPLGWSNSTLIKTDIAKTLARLKAEREDNFLVFGSGVLVQSLMRWHLVDDLTLLIHPLVLGSGRRLFPSDDLSANLQLRDAKPTSNGVVVLTYQPEQ